MEKNGSSGRKSKETDYQSALNRAAALCSKQEYCSAQILEKLAHWGISGADGDRILQHLIREKYVDDSRYASFFVKDKFRFNGWGRIKIRFMLRARKISEEAIEQALEEIDKEAYYEACLNLVRQKSAGLKEKNPFNRKGRLFRFASGRGFEPELVHRAIGEVERDSD